MGTLIFFMLPPSQIFFLNSQFFCKIPHFTFPIVKRLFPIVFTDKILKLHQIKFKSAMDKLTHGDLVAKYFSLLRDAKRNLYAHSINYIFEIQKYPLRDLGAKICF